MESKEIIMARLKNEDLAFEMESILSMDLPIVLSLEYDANLDYPFAIDIEDNSYFYANEAERNSDYINLYQLLQPLGFTFHDKEVDGFRLYSVDQFNLVFETDVQPYDNCEVVSDKVDNAGHSYFYVSGCGEDVLEAIKAEQDVADQLYLDLVCLLPSCTFIAIY